MFSDQYLDKEENNKLQEVIFRWLTSDDISLNPIDAEDPEARRGRGRGEGWAKRQVTTLPLAMNLPNGTQICNAIIVNVYLCM